MKFAEYSALAEYFVFKCHLTDFFCLSEAYNKRKTSKVREIYSVRRK